MTLRELVSRCRSYRRFHESHTITMATLEHLVGLARLTASAANLQPLRYVLVTDPQTRAKVFDTLLWAAYLKEWSGPVPGERPSAYIVVLGETERQKTSAWDLGISAQTIMLGAVEQGLGGCILASLKKPELAAIVSPPDGLEILAVLALGKPAETVVIDSLAPGGDVKYWRDENMVHHVPKRELKDLIVGKFGT
ncbi:MAG: nitroreductase family protein [Desulfovibrio sp.]|nr:nitroreductase family protein [Desulfovibrio sp.]